MYQILISGTRSPALVSEGEGRKEKEILVLTTSVFAIRPVGDYAAEPIDPAHDFDQSYNLLKSSVKFSY